MTHQALKQRGRPGNNLERRIALGYGMALALLLAVATASQFSLKRAEETEQLVAHTYNVRSKLEDLFSQLIDVQRGARGFVITGDESYLLPYHSGRAAIEKRLAELKGLILDEGRRQRLIDLEPAIDRQLEILAGIVEARRKVGFQAAVEAVRAGEGKRLMDEVLRHLHAIEAAQDELLRQRSELSRKTSDLTGRINLAGGFLALAIVVVSIIATNRGLSARRQAEAALARSEEEARKQAEILGSVLNSISDGVAVADETGRLTLFNPAAEHLCGKGRTDAGPEEWSAFYQSYLPDGKTLFPVEQVPLVRAIRGESADNVEMLLCPPNRAEPVQISASARPLKNTDGAPRGGVVVFRDVTAAKNAEQALIRAKEAAERASRFKDQFLSTMSHELRTPLNAVLGFSGLLRDPRWGALNEQQSKFAEHIQSGGKHLLGLINDILDLSRIEAGRMELAPEAFPVHLTITEVVDALQPLAQKKSQTLTYKAHDKLTIRADHRRFKQVLMNLVGNAIKFTPEHGSIQVNATGLDGQVRIEVRDTGPGIPPEHQQRVFEAFSRLRDIGEKTEGTGLGLAISQKLVELHGGKLQLESEVGQGSCFYFSLPRLVDQPVSVAAPAVTAEGLHGDHPLILVIEDDETALRLIETSLQSAGYVVHACLQPEQAESMAEHLRPAAITLDLLMQPINGWQVLTRLKQNSKTSHIPVVILSIVDQPAMGALLGADEYLVKPVEKDALLAAVKRCLLTPARHPQGPILVVEDDPAMRDILGALLSSEGYAVRLVADGRQARASMLNSLPEMVILDLMLPEISGFDLLTEWRANPATVRLPVVILTSKELTFAEEQFLRANSQSLLLKKHPWERALLDTLQQKLGRAMGQQP